MSEVYSALEQARLRREAQLGNATRDATVHLTYNTDGVGETTTAALAFGCAFLDPPHVSTGVVAATFPDTTLYRYPSVSAGVWRWQTQATSDPTNPLYVGAWIWINVQCDPRITPRTDGGLHDYYQDKLAQEEATISSNVRGYQVIAQAARAQQALVWTKKPGTPEYAQAAAQWAALAQEQANFIMSAGGSGDMALRAMQELNEAQLALRLQQNPPQVRLTHHLSFSGIATQAYSLDDRFRDAISPIPVDF